MSIINKIICLKLNSAWQAIGMSSIQKAIVDLASGKSAMALDVEYEKDENGNYVIDEFGSPCGQSIVRPVEWDEWMTLPVRSFDNPIHYGNGTKVMRAPTVLIAKNFSKMPKKSFNGAPSKDAIWIRDNGKCQYTGKKLNKEIATVDHVIPKSKGGKNEWENMVLTSREINFKKGNKLNKEIGLKLLKEPKSPKPIPLSHLIREIKHKDWKPFLPHLEN